MVIGLFIGEFTHVIELVYYYIFAYLLVYLLKYLFVNRSNWCVLLNYSMVIIGSVRPIFRLK